VTTDVCASTAESDRFLCKICPGTIQLDVNPVSYFILPDRKTYQRHESASLATDTAQLYKSCKNIRIFTEVDTFDWENIKYEFRGCWKSIDLTSGNYYVDSARCSLSLVYLPTSYRAKKDVIPWNAQTYIMTRCIVLHFVLGTSKVGERCVHVNHTLFTADTEGKTNLEIFPVHLRSRARTVFSHCRLFWLPSELHRGTCRAQYREISTRAS